VDLKGVQMIFKEVELTDEILAELISCSENWEKENSRHGYRKNTEEDIKGNRIYKAILHFYLDELGMEFWNARLFKRI